MRMTPDYFRDLARRCRSWAHECFDLEGAMRFRMLADEFLTKAKDLESDPRASGDAFTVPHRSQHQSLQQQQAKTNDNSQGT
jgi:hypothetical protein